MRSDSATRPAPREARAGASLGAGFAATARRLRVGLARLPRRAEGRAGERRREALQRLGDDARRARGQDLPRRLHRLAVDAVGLGHSAIENPSGAYHLVWSRDLYQIATALIAAGDTAGANRAVDYLFFRQQKPDGSFPQNSTVDGTEHWAQSPARRGRAADRARLAARPHRACALPRPHQEGRRLPRELQGRATRLDAAGALGEPERLLAGHDRVRDRRPRVRRGHRAAQRRHRVGRPLRAHRRRLAGARGGLDRHEQRALLARAVLPAADEGR